MASETPNRQQATDIYTPAPREHDTSLTSPADRTGILPPNARGIPPLTHEQTQAIVQENVDTLDLSIPRIERRYAYSAPENRGGTHQNYGVFVFVPSKGATPDSQGIYGMIKLGGNYEQLMDAEARTEKIVREEDSYNRLRIVRVGHPSLLTVDSRWELTDEEHCNEVDLRRRAAAREDGGEALEAAERMTREQLREARMKDKKEMEEIKERAENLQKTVDELADDPAEQYTTLRGKLAQLTWAYLRTRDQQEKAKESILKTREEIAEFEANDPTLFEEMKRRFHTAREAAGIPANDDSFIKYINEDGAAELGF